MELPGWVLGIDEIRRHPSWAFSTDMTRTSIDDAKPTATETRRHPNPSAATRKPPDP
jgi:hypothetical protein